MATSGTFVYSDNLANVAKRQSIRILELLRGETSDPITCRLRTVALRDRPLYDALSYRWGGDDVEITCNGFPLKVGDHLINALRHLRHHDKSVYLWADAICINQDPDSQEKSFQIPLMRSIYKEAAEVKIWLGEENTETADAFRLLQRIRKVGIKLGPKLRPLRVLGSRFQVSHDLPFPGWVSDIEDLSWNPWPPLVRLLDREWFSRVWVIQEAALASKATVICGSEAMTLDHFEAALDTMAVLLSGDGDNFNMQGMVAGMKAAIAISEARRGIRENKRRRLLDLLIDHHQSKATEPNDRIYGLLGIASDVELVESTHNTPKLDVTVDKKNPANPKMVISIDTKADPRDVYKKVAAALLEMYGNLEVLSAAQPSKNMILPSWVPDWSVPLQARILSRTITENEFAAAGSSICRPCVLENELVVRGFVVDKITDVSGEEKARPEFHFRHMNRFVRELVEQEYQQMKFCQMHKQRKYFGENIDVAYTKTRSAGADGRPQSGGWYSTLLIYQANRFLRAIGCSKLLILVTIPFTIPALFLYKKSVTNTNRTEQGVGKSRRLMRSEQGYLGLGPANAEAGDAIVLLEGGALPFIVRLEKDSTREDVLRGKLVGEAYVHGLMEGQKWDPTRCKGICFD